MASLQDIDRDVLREWMVRYITSVLSLPAEGFDAAARFDTYGLDSVEAVVMAGVMEEEFAVAIDPILFFEHQSVEAFVTDCAGEPGARPPSESVAG